MDGVVAGLNATDTSSKSTFIPLVPVLCKSQVVVLLLSHKIALNYQLKLIKLFKPETVGVN